MTGRGVREAEPCGTVEERIEVAKRVAVFVEEKEYRGEVERGAVQEFLNKMAMYTEGV